MTYRGPRDKTTWPECDESKPIYSILSWSQVTYKLLFLICWNSRNNQNVVIINYTNWRKDGRWKHVICRITWTSFECCSHKVPILTTDVAMLSCIQFHVSRAQVVGQESAPLSFVLTKAVCMCFENEAINTLKKESWKYYLASLSHPQALMLIISRLKNIKKNTKKKIVNWSRSYRYWIVYQWIYVLSKIWLQFFKLRKIKTGTVFEEEEEEEDAADDYDEALSLFH